MSKDKINLAVNRAGVWFGIIFVLLLPLVYTPFTLDPALMARFAVWAIALSGFFIWLKFSDNQLLDYLDFSILNRLIFPLLLAWFLIAGTSVFVAVNVSEAIVEWIKIVPFILFIALGSILFSQDKHAKYTISRIVIVFALIQSLIGISQLIIVLLNADLSHTLSYYINGLSAHRNLFSQILLFSLPFTVHGIIAFKSKWRILAIIASVTTFMLIVVLLTKSVWMAVILSSVSVFVFFLNYFRFFDLKLRVFRKIAIAFVSFVALVVLSVFIYVQFDSWETIDKQADWIRNYRFGSSLERIDLWQKSVDIYRDYPMRGVGAGNWKIVLPSYGTDGLRSEEGVVNFVRPHNDFLSVLSETGIFGFLLYLGFFVSLFYYIYKIVKSKAPKEDKVFSLFMLTGLISYLIISLLSFPKERVEHSIFLALYTIFIVTDYHRIFPLQNENYFKRKKIYYVLVFFFLGFAIIIGIARSLSEYHLKKALNYRANQDWSQVIDECDKAENIFTKLDNTSIPIAWYKASALFNSGKHNQAFNEFKRAYSYNPNNIHVLNNLASAYELKGNHDKAIELYKRAINTSSSFEDASINLCAVYFNLGDIEDAYQSIRYLNANSNHPNYKKSIDLVLKTKIENLLPKIVDRDVKLSVERINNSTEWITKVFKQSQKNNTDFDNQVFEEAIYVMETMDSTITSSRAKYFRDKYIYEDND